MKNLELNINMRKYFLEIIIAFFLFNSSAYAEDSIKIKFLSFDTQTFSPTTPINIVLNSNGEIKGEQVAIVKDILNSQKKKDKFTYELTRVRLEIDNRFIYIDINRVVLLRPGEAYKIDKESFEKLLEILEDVSGWTKVIEEQLKLIERR